MKYKCLVTGANGHLGNNLIRTLLKQNYQVRAGIRNMNNKEPFRGLDCDIRYVDLLVPSSLSKALQGIDVLFQVAAVFKHWSKNSRKDIIQANLTMTQNIIEAAASCKIKKIIYVSSMAALDHTRHPMNADGWNQDKGNPYYQAKTDSERLAFELASRYKIPFVSVLPAAIIGPNCFGTLTPTMNVLDGILKNKLPFDPDFNLNYIHVDDVVDGMIAAMEKGNNGQRYILGNESASSITDVFQVANRYYPQVKIPKKRSKLFLKTIAGLMELTGKMTGKEPSILRSQVDIYHRSDQRLDISKSRRDLDFSPRPANEAIHTTLNYLRDR